MAVLRDAYADETLVQTLSRLTSNGVSITDSRNGIVKPRLSLLEAARPANNAFAARIALNGSSGNVAGSNRAASKESGEPAHAGNAGGRSVWWTWTAPATGQVSLDTHGSGFDTLLAVYTGSAVGALAAVAANDNDGSAQGAGGLLFQAVSGQNYPIAVDGFDGASGDVLLNWSLNVNAQANLSVTISGPASGVDGGTYGYAVTAANAGPQSATGVVASLTLPAEAGVVEMPAGCSASGATVTCGIGTLPAGGSLPLNFQLIWTNAGDVGNLVAGISSDVPDPVANNNAGSFQIAFQAGGDGDVPTLPEWGLILLAGLLGLAVMRQRGHGPRGA
ncbi:MAG: DUF11 domain-containing protein [Sulfuritalea sp.]|nr:DUF11 domain-containing protein [Sulfuritalea sp.]